MISDVTVLSLSCIKAAAALRFSQNVPTKQQSYWSLEGMWSRFAYWHAQSADLGEFSLLKCIDCDLSCSLHACCMSLWDGKCLASTKLSPDAKIRESRFLADSEKERRNDKKQISIKAMHFKGLHLGVVTLSFNFMWLFMFILNLHGRLSGVAHSYWVMCFIILEANKECGRLYPQSKSFQRAQ